MRTILWMLYFWAYLIGLIPTMRRAKTMAPEKRDELTARMAQQWATRLLRKAGAQVTVEGQQNIPQETVVIVGNHQGLFDIPLVLSAVPKGIGFFSKIEVKKIPLIRTWMEYLHCVFVTRGDRRSSMEALHQAIHVLKQGHSMVIFPEGTRNTGRELGPFQGGAFSMAKKAGVKILPVCINGTQRLMEDNHYWIKPAKVGIRILEPIDVSAMDKEQLKTLAEDLRQRLAQERADMMAKEQEVQG